MRRRMRCAAVFGALICCLLLGSLSPSAGAPIAERGPKPASADGHGGALLVGAASRSVLPTVEGGYDYLAAGLPGPRDPYPPGVFVPRFDQGRVAVGNGADRSFWVHDDVRVRAVAIDDVRSPRLTVLVSADLYLVFRADADGIRRKVAERLPPHVRKPVDVVIAATHNHHGPDTAFDVNHTWYEHMTDQAADAVLAAVASRRPAVLRVASGTHWFGMSDGTDPQVIDPTLNVLQAVGRGGKAIATVVQWNNHPETTLGTSPPVTPADCGVLTSMGQTCTAKGRYFTADYPGVVARSVARRAGGEVLYFVGALGVLAGPGDAKVWEVDASHPPGDEHTPPPGALAPGGGTDYTARNFRRAQVIGEQVAAKALHLLETAEPVSDTRLTYREHSVFTRLSHRGFRRLLVTDTAGRPQGLGHEVTMLYTCPAHGPKNEDTCGPDQEASVSDPVLGQIRVGDHLRTSVGYLRIGSRIGLLLMPGEMAGELVIGLPAGFRRDPGRWYQGPHGDHAFGPALQTPGYVRGRMSEPYGFTIGLGNDQLGYVLPISDYRVSCTADVLTGRPGTCARLHESGAIEYPDAVAGNTCKQLAEDPAAGRRLEKRSGVQSRRAVEDSCAYGQALGAAHGHYEETNSAGWDLAQDILDATAALTGNRDTSQVNPDFPGHYSAYPP